MTLGSRCLSPDRRPPTTGAVPLGLPAETRLETFGGSRLALSRALTKVRARRSHKLIGAIEKLDFSRGYNFGTYASWTIRHNLFRDRAKSRPRNRLVTGHESMIEAAPDRPADECLGEAEQEHREEAIREMLDRLDDRGRTIIIRHFGLGGTCEMTLEEIGKERGRQLENRARDKLRKLAEEQAFDLPASCPPSDTCPCARDQSGAGIPVYSAPGIETPEERLGIVVDGHPGKSGDAAGFDPTHNMSSVVLAQESRTWKIRPSGIV